MKRRATHRFRRVRSRRLSSGRGAAGRYGEAAHVARIRLQGEEHTLRRECPRIRGLPRRCLSAFFHKYDNVLFAVFVPSLLCSFWEGINVPRKSPYKIVLTKQEREELERRANKYTLPYFIVARAKMMLLAEQGLSNDEIATSLSTRRSIVSRCRNRYFEK